MNEYIKELKILRTEITAIKNSISSMKTINNKWFGVEYEYERDEDGNIKSDEDGNPIIKLDEYGYPIIKETGLGKYSKFLIDEFKKHFLISYLRDDEGNLILDEDKNPIINTENIGTISKLIINSFIKYLEVPYKKDGNGKYILDNDGNKIFDEEYLGDNPNYFLYKLLQYFKIEYTNNGTDIIVNESTLGEVTKFIYSEFSKRFDTPNGEFSKYINKSFEDRFSIEDEESADGTITALLKFNHNEVITKIDKFVKDNTNNFNAIILKLDTIENTINGISDKLNTISENVISAKDNANSAFNKAWDNALSLTSITTTLNSLGTAIYEIKNIVDTIDHNTKPTE